MMCKTNEIENEIKRACVGDWQLPTYTYKEEKESLVLIVLMTSKRTLIFVRVIQTSGERRSEAINFSFIDG